MKLFLRRWTHFVLILCSLALATSNAQLRPEVIRKIQIRHVGPPAASDALIRANIRVKEGDTYTATSVDDDVRSLLATGYFHNVQVVLEPDPAGLTVAYVIQGKPVISEINIVGNKKYSKKKILKKVTSKVGEPLSEAKLFTDKEDIRKLYEKAGYQRTTVKYQHVDDASAGRSAVTFEIAESPKIKIKDIEFVGAQAFKQKKLRKSIKTKHHWMFSWITGSGVVKDEQLEDDKDKLADFYRDAGYIDFELKEVKSEPVDPKHVVLKFVVDEGQRYRVGSVTISGNTNFTSDEILKGVRSMGKTIKPKMTE